jgi:hypothetical protein
MTARINTIPPIVPPTAALMMAVLEDLRLSEFGSLFKNAGRGLTLYAHSQKEQKMMSKMMSQTVQ